MLKTTYGDTLALFVGTILTLAFAPFSIFPLAIIALFVLELLFISVSCKRAFLRGWLFGIGLFGTGVSWIFISIHTYGNASILLSMVITLCFISILAIFPGLSGYLLNRYFPLNNSTKILYTFPAIWVLLEWMRSWFLTGFPWLFLGDSQINSPLRGFAPIFSVYGVSFAVLLCASTCLNAYLNFKAKHFKAGVFSILFFMLIWLVGGILNTIHWTTPKGEPVKISLIQGNIPQEIKWNETAVIPTLQAYEDLTRKHWDSKLIIWPESAIPLSLQDATSYVNQLDQEARKHQAAILTGITVKNVNDAYFNAIIAIGHQSRDFYLKRRLVPFGEYTPFPALFEKIMHQIDIPMSNLIAGTGKFKLIQANHFNISAFICYEIAFPEQVLSHNSNDIDFLLSVNNDAWFGKSIAQAQHLEMAQMRALEMGRPLLFVSNTGLTAFINAKGQIQSKAPPYQTYVLSDSVQRMIGKTPWQQQALDPLLIILFILIAKSLWIQKKQHRINKS